MRVPSWILLLAPALGACTGYVGEGGPDGANPGAGSVHTGGSASTVPTADPDGTASEDATVGRSPLRRLGKLELSRTLRDLLPSLPEGFDPSADVPIDNEIQLAFSLPGTVSDLEVKRFMDMAEAALSALGDAAPGNQFACAGADETSCARAFIESFGKRAFRRPLEGVEVDDLIALYDELRTDPEMAYGFVPALGVVSEAILQSPGFLYRWERGLKAPQLDGDVVKFDGYEIASRLSYYIWNSMPDDALLAEADAGTLGTPDQIAAQARRLLGEARADGALGDFITQWLELGTLPSLIKDANVYPEFSVELRSSMLAETLAFSKDVLRGSTPTFTSLLTAGYSFVDAPLAAYYGLVPDASGRVDLDGSGRLGLLTQAAVMAVKGNSYRTSPVRRGKFILNRLICFNVPPPPPNVVTELPPPDPNLTLREQMAAHRDNPTCAGCHKSMDSLGFAFEHFDGAGKYRETDGAHAIDASGSFTLDDVATSFSNASDLAWALAASPEAQACFARQWLRYAIDRFEQDADQAASDYLASAYSESGLDTRQLIVEITRTLPFSHRAPADDEVLTP